MAGPRISMRIQRSPPRRTGDGGSAEQRLPQQRGTTGEGDDPKEALERCWESRGIEGRERDSFSPLIVGLLNGPGQLEEFVMPAGQADQTTKRMHVLCSASRGLQRRCRKSCLVLWKALQCLPCFSDRCSYKTGQLKSAFLLRLRYLRNILNSIQLQFKCLTDI